MVFMKNKVIHIRSPLSAWLSNMGFIIFLFGLISDFSGHSYSPIFLLFACPLLALNVYANLKTIITKIKVKRRSIELYVLRPYVIWVASQKVELFPGDIESITLPQYWERLESDGTSSKVQTSDTISIEIKKDHARFVKKTLELDHSRDVEKVIKDLLRLNRDIKIFGDKAEFGIAS